MHGVRGRGNKIKMGVEGARFIVLGMNCEGTDACDMRLRMTVSSSGVNSILQMTFQRGSRLKMPNWNSSV